MKTLKEKHLDQLAAYHKELQRAPKLKHFFLELTLRCNAHCFHCGSNCTPEGFDELSTEEFKGVLEQIRDDFDIREILLCITGGEPMLHRDFFEIMDYANRLGYHWGMTSNATLITKENAHRLADCGMRTISVSIDGLQKTHDELRGLPGGYDLAMRGLQNLIDENAFRSIQVTSVINHKNIDELDDMFDVMDAIDIDSWRVVNLEPIGRALKRPDLMCTKEDYIRLFEFIREKREMGYPVEYGCSHYLGPEYEREVRKWYWLCNAGIYTGSVMANGDIGACLDIERRPETIMGNIRKDRFKDVWESGFKIFRQDLSEKNENCASCTHKHYCRGDSFHSWDYEHNRPMVCMKDILF